MEKIFFQKQWRKRSSVKIMERTYQERTEALQRWREGCRFEASPFGQSANFGSVWRTESEADGVLPLAKGVLRERSGGLSGSRRPHRQVEEKQRRIEFLEKKVQTKDEVLAELMAEHIALKKTLGEL